MGQIAAIGLDIVAVAIILWCTNAAAQKGFLRTVIQMIAYIVILIASLLLSRAAAPVIYDNIVEPMLLESVQPNQSSQPENAVLISMAPRGTLSILDTASDALGSLDLDSLLKGFDKDQLIGDIADATIRPLLISAVSMISFVIIFAILSMIANLLLSTLGIIDHIPIIGTCNSVLGGAVGVFQGILLVLVLCILLKGLLHLHPSGWWILNEDVLEHTYICRYLLNLDVIGRLFA